MDLGMFVRQAISERKISKAELSRRIGCTTRAIDYWQNGERNMSLENADKLLRTLDITISIGLTSTEIEDIK